ncbi:DUF4336 domain-containing protein [Deltaproteobacteria bacterium TL4]
MQSIKPFSNDIWTVDMPQRFHGIQLGTRMTIVRFPNENLWVHSPVAVTPETVVQMKELGNVAYIIAPNRLHYLYVAGFQAHFPEAKTYFAPKLAKKCPDLRCDVELTTQIPAAWADVMDQRLIEGIPRFQEVFFLHKPTQTLIVTDAIYHLGSIPSLMTKLIALVSRRLKPTGLFNDRQIPLVKDDKLVSDSLRQIQQWDFDKIIMAHGANIQSHGKEIFEAIYQDLLTENTQGRPNL